LGASCHNAAEIWHAQKIGVDYISLSPVMPTASHPDQKSLGWDGFTVFAAACPMPVFALGGLGDPDINQSKVAGGFGIAAISAWW
jgi:8-oxo-dGTP diphosphatase